MTSERSQAYGRVVKALEDLSASKFHDDQQQTIRDAADALFFCEDLTADPDAREALARLHELAAHLKENDVLVEDTVDAIVADVEGCGPFAPVS